MSLLFALCAASLVVPADRSTLLIVAPKAWCAALEPFAASKRALPWMDGCEVVALENLCAETPSAGATSDEAEQLKRALFARWQNAAKDARVDSVLLVGDSDALPYRFMMLDRGTKPACDVAFYPSDLYYADLADDAGAFDDWNARRDGIHASYIGEVHGETNKDGPIDADGCGLVPELAVGRWPVSSVEDAVAVARKTMAHDAAVASARADHETCPPITILACPNWIDNAAHIETVAISLEPSFAVERLFYSSSDAAHHPTHALAADALATPHAAIFHTGHGQPSQWEHALRQQDLTQNAASARLPVLFSIGCSTSEVCAQPPYSPYVDAQGVAHAGTNAGEVFTQPPPAPACRQSGSASATSMGEHAIRCASGGAVASIGCVTGSQPCAHTLLDAFAESLGAQPDAAVGECWRNAVRAYVEREHLASLTPTDSWYPPSIYFQPMKFILLGDPTARVR